MVKGEEEIEFPNGRGGFAADFGWFSNYVDVERVLGGGSRGMLKRGRKESQRDTYDYQGRVQKRP